MAAGRAFSALGMDLVAGDDPLGIDDLRAYLDDGRAWVVDADARPVGYLLVDVVDGCAHIEQVSVRPEYRGLRLGRALVDQAADWARGERLDGLTLTTYREVPWNGPYYESLGFVYVTPSPGLARIRSDEAAAGLDAWPRGCMRRAL
ncbi:GNAT family N-acetyltransferase [Gordonia shandongensis]|uniref:GNAT family N-acetyltransferase n=1 Tax=Gordonia shandongensis TaxID=376351 RepID=UPI001FDF4238|nr:GNAT family N-acetyltransferase [Gordonia shandongensis]